LVAHVIREELEHPSDILALIAYLSLITTSCAVFGPISNRAIDHDIVRYFV
jgi:hypothetical protein